MLIISFCGDIIMRKYLTDAEFIGQKFNHLTVIEKGPAYVSPAGHTNS